MRINRIHHIAVICSDYAMSKDFYVRVLGLRVIAETFREQRNSFKLDLAVPGGGQIELFSFPGSPARASYPEACGLRHVAFEVDDIEAAIAGLVSEGILVEAVRTDKLTGRRFTFFADPDGLPIELYEASGQ